MRSISVRGLVAVFAIVMIVVAGALVAPEIRAQQVSPDADTAEVGARVVDAKGAWSPNKNYVTDDLVTSRGSTWRAKRANKNKVPGSTNPSTAADWELFAAGFNPVGAWLGTKTYHINDLVSFQGATWRAKRTSKNKTPPTHAADWQQFAAKGATGPAGPSSVGAGTASAPSFSFTGDSNTGIFSPSAGKIALVEDGALFLHNKGTQNTALGLSALASNTTGFANTAVGDSALSSNTTGFDNIALGQNALSANTTGSSNTALGQNALASNTTGNSNTALGRNALSANTTGFGNTALGLSALVSNTTGGDNTALGFTALNNNTSDRNTAVGRSALRTKSTGTNNVALGFEAGKNPTDPNYSIFIGNPGVAADTTTIKIGEQGTQTTTFIAGIAGKTVANSAAVLINTSTGQLGTVASSRRYKQDIAPMGDVTEMLQKLRPVTFRYKQAQDDGTGQLQYGLIAEEVAETLPYLTVFNKDGQPETVKYHLLPSFLLAGYQQQQKTIEAQAERDRQQQETIASLEQRLAALEAKLGRLAAR